MMYWSGNGMSGWGYALMTVSTLLFWTLLITGIVLLVRSLGGHQTPSPLSRQPKQSDPEGILAERFARGEIDDEEYHRRAAVLRESNRA